jgi:hypothetical protein
MTFKEPQAVETIILQLVYAEWARATNRSAINQLFNGFPPYSEQEQIQNNINVNVNDLTGTNLAMAARGQFTNALVTPNPLVNIEIDHGPVWKRREWQMKVEAEFNRIIKRSLPFQEEEESTFANVVLHGIGGSIWTDKERWVPKAKLVEDILVPGRTLRSLENLQMFAVREQYTGMQLRKMTQGPNRDKAWNMPMVERLIKWVDAETHRLMGNYWPETWQPEKWAERWKEDSGLFTGDDVPTVDTFHFYFWNDEGKVAGWNKRIILDTWGNPGLSAAATSGSVANRPKGKYGKNVIGPRTEFIYDPGERKYADEVGQIAHWQFGDASAVAPFRYHSVRSLGFLLYAVCHLQNRIKCRMSEAAFESLLQYFRVTNPEDAERATKVDLINRGVIPDGINFMPQAERWQTNESLAEAVMAMYRQTIDVNSASFTQGPENPKEGKDETATAVMARVNSTSQLIGSMLGRAYNYQTFKFREIGRRFAMKDSRDPDVKEFRLNCLKAGVPAEALNFERWTMAPVRVVGNGNKMMQVALMDKMMATVYDKLDPSAQKDMLRLFIAVNTSDYDLANRSVPEMKSASPTVFQSQTDSGTLLQGLPVVMKEGLNHQEYVATMLHSMTAKISQLEMSGGMATMAEIQGLGMMAQTIQAHLKILAQDKRNKAMVKTFGDDLGKLMNLVKAYAQRLQQQKGQQGQQPDPKDAAKAQVMIEQGKLKNKIASDSHAQRTAQKQVEFQQRIEQDTQKHRVDLVKTDLEAASNIRRNGRHKAFEE